MNVNHLLLRSNSDLAREDLLESVSRLQQITGNPRVFQMLIPQAFRLLESLPLATSEYELAHRRLENAQRYINSKEPGAAKYELRMLAASLNVPNSPQDRLNDQEMVGPPTEMYKQIKSRTASF